jgi:proline-specific peptidase
MERSCMKEGFLKRAEGNVWYGVAGEETGRAPLLVVHGGPGAPHDYLEPLERLSIGRQVIFYDQLGCGNSDRPDGFHGWTLEYFTDELIDVIRMLGLHDVHLLGQSYGAMLAVNAMLKEPSLKVRSLTLSGPCLSSKRFALDQRPHVDALDVVDRQAILEGEKLGVYDSEAYQDALMAFYRKHVCRMDPWPECLERAMAKMGEEVYHTMWGPSEFTLTGNLKDVDLTGRLHEIGAPVLLTCGAFDEATPQTISEYKSLFKDARMVIFEDGSHEHHLEHEEAYLGIVDTFLDDTGF